MAKKQEYVVNKMYEWELDVEGKLVKWKFFLGVDECITYEGNKECQRLKIENLVQKRGVLQLDTEVKVYDSVIPLQLECGIPYIKLPNEDGELKWRSSDTTREDRITIRSYQVKRESYLNMGLGCIFLIGTLIRLILQGTLGDWPFEPVMGIMFIAAGLMNMIRLKNELEAMDHPFSWKLKN